MHVWPGKSYPLGATWDGAGVNFASSPSTRPRSSFAFSIRPNPQARVSAFFWLNRRSKFGMLTCPASSRINSMAIESTAPMSRRKVTDSIPASWCWTRTPRRSDGT